jgi:hypothetical protein
MFNENVRSAEHTASNYVLKLDGMWTEADYAEFKVLSLHWLRRTEEDHKNLSQDTGSMANI